MKQETTKSQRIDLEAKWGGPADLLIFNLNRKPLHRAWIQQLILNVCAIFAIKFWWIYFQFTFFILCLGESEILHPLRSVGQTLYMHVHGIGKLDQKNIKKKCTLFS